MTVVFVVASTRAASAYTIESPLSSGCHEKITTEALRDVRRDMATAAPLPVTADQHALVEDLQFLPAADMKDLGGATLLIGVRDNDLKGRGSTELSQLAEVHGNPEAQREHCLRNPEDLEPGGSAQALVQCRAFILEKVAAALDGLNADGTVDLAKVTTLPVTLSVRGRVNAVLPTFYVHMGQAIHTVEDSFTHTYRTSDGSKVTVVLNWLGVVSGKLVEARDGPPHLAGLDRCDDPDETRKTRRELATAAAAGILRSALDPAISKAQKLAEVDAILSQNLGYEAGCTADNQWCSAPEANDKSNGRGCRAQGGSGFAALVAMLLSLVTRLRAKARRVAVVAACAIGFLGASSAQAETVDPASPPTASEVAASPSADYKMAYGVYGAFSGAFDKPALAAEIGFRLRVTRHWAFGVDAEWNPWIALSGRPIRAGAINVYGTAILRIPLWRESFNLRTTANIGASYLLSSLYGAPSGSVGLYLGVSPLGVEWKVSSFTYLILNPLNLAVPIPQLPGVPFLYPQYRITLGIEFSTAESIGKPTVGETLKP